MKFCYHWDKVEAFVNAPEKSANDECILTGSIGETADRPKRDQGFDDESKEV